jgi:hypothetical protein
LFYCDKFAGLQVLEFVAFTLVLEAPTHEAAVEWQHALDILLDEVVPALRSSSSSTSTRTHSLPSTRVDQHSAAALLLSEQSCAGEGRGS